MQTAPHCLVQKPWMEWTMAPAAVVAATRYRTTHRQDVADGGMAVALGYAKEGVWVVEDVDRSLPQTFAHPTDPGSRERTMIDSAEGPVHRILRLRYA
jgi:CO/xanthine dehydrogenase FAD-binding subunit